MKSTIYLRVSLLAIMVAISLFFFSYARKAPTDKEETCGQEKCCGQKAHTEFILWESISRNLLSASR